MTSFEYERLQTDLSHFIKYNPYLGRNRAKAFEDGVLACKSVLSHFNPEKTSVDDPLDREEGARIKEAFSRILDKPKAKMLKEKEAEAYKNGVMECMTRISAI